MKHVSPIIIIGMRESGIGNVTKILESLGVFMGRTKNRANESILFHDINTWILKQFSAGIEDPLPLMKELKDWKIREQYVVHIREILNTRLIVSYLGWLKYFLHNDPSKLSSPWGWSDSINIITLNIWLDIFPHAKIIHVYRHPMDVSDMLIANRTKSLSKLKNTSKKWYKYFYWYYLAIKYIPDKVLVGMRCSSPEEALSLWKEYMTIARSYSKSLDSNSFMEIRYEDLIKNSEQTIKGLADFCNLELQISDMIKIRDILKDEHLNMYMNNSQLKDFSDQPEVAKVIESFYS